MPAADNQDEEVDRAFFFCLAGKDQRHESSPTADYPSITRPDAQPRDGNHDIAKKQSLSHEALLHIRALATKALEVMSDSRSDKGGKKRVGINFKVQNKDFATTFHSRLNELKSVEPCKKTELFWWQHTNPPRVERVITPAARVN